MSRSPTAASILALAALLAATGAQAHAHLVNAAPAAKSTVGAPEKVQLQFSEKLEPKFSKLALTRADGASVAVTSEVSAKDAKIIEAAPKAPLTPGGYKVSWRIVSADGHKMTGDYAFTVK